MSLIKLTNDFTVTPNEILNNDKLSLKAKGLWVYLNSKPNGWNYSVNGTVKQNKDGYDSVSSGMKELENEGYLVRKPNKGNNGEFNGYDYYLYSIPVNHKTINGNTVKGKPMNGEPHNHSNTNKSKSIISKKDLRNDLFSNKSDVSFLPNEIIKYLNGKIKEKNPNSRGFGLLESHLKHIKTRLKTKGVKYNLEDFKKVIDYKIYKWYDDPKAKEWLRPKTLFGDNFDTYLNEALNYKIEKDEDYGQNNFIHRKTTYKDIL